MSKKIEEPAMIPLTRDEVFNLIKEGMVEDVYMHKVNPNRHKLFEPIADIPVCKLIGDDNIYCIIKGGRASDIPTSPVFRDAR